VPRGGVDRRARSWRVWLRGIRTEPIHPGLLQRRQIDHDSAVDHRGPGEGAPATTNDDLHHPPEAAWLARLLPPRSLGRPRRGQGGDAAVALPARTRSHPPHQRPVPRLRHVPVAARPAPYPGHRPRRCTADPRVGHRHHLRRLGPLHDPSRGAPPIAVWEFSLGVYLTTQGLQARGRRSLWTSPAGRRGRRPCRDGWPRGGGRLRRIDVPTPTGGCVRSIAGVGRLA